MNQELCQVPSLLEDDASHPRSPAVEYLTISPPLQALVLAEFAEVWKVVCLHHLLVLKVETGTWVPVEGGGHLHRVLDLEARHESWRKTRVSL